MDITISLNSKWFNWLKWLFSPGNSFSFNTLSQVKSFVMQIQLWNNLPVCLFCSLDTSHHSYPTPRQLAAYYEEYKLTMSPNKLALL